MSITIETATHQANALIEGIMAKMHAQHPELGVAELEIGAIKYTMMKLIVSQSKLDAIEIPVVLAPGGQLPMYQKDGDVAADVYALPMICPDIRDESTWYRVDSITVPARGRALVHSGARMALPEGWRAQMEARSGLALHEGIEVGAGVIDTNYRGEFAVLLHNHTDTDYVVKKGDRVGQMLICKFTKGLFKLVDTLPESARNFDAWGSSGV